MNDLLSKELEKKGKTAGELEMALRNRYGRKEWALFFQVRDATGFQGSRTADAIAMGLWPSRGLELIGFEIKAYRGDWLRELKRPEKAEEIAKYCDRWYIVAGAKEVVKHDELPLTWGLLVPHGDGLRIAKEAATLKPEPIDRLFLAALLRRAALATPGEETIKAARDEGYKAGKEEVERTRKFDRECRERLEAQAKAFEAASGIHITEYCDGKELGEAVRLVRAGAVQQAHRLMKTMHSDARALLEHIEQIMRKHDIETFKLK